MPILSNRGEVLDLPSGLQVLITVHPSALLRLRDENERRAAYEAFVSDLRSVARIVGLDVGAGAAERNRLDSMMVLLAARQIPPLSPRNRRQAIAPPIGVVGRCPAPI